MQRDQQSPESQPPEPPHERRVWEGILHPGEGDDLLISTFWGTEALNLEAFLNRKVRITIETIDE